MSATRVPEDARTTHEMNETATDVVTMEVRR